MTDPRQELPNVEFPPLSPPLAVVISMITCTSTLVTALPTLRLLSGVLLISLAVSWLRWRHGLADKESGKSSGCLGASRCLASLTQKLSPLVIKFKIQMQETGICFINY